MELVNTNDEIFFDPTPRLKSSPIPIKFISFNSSDENCFNCGETYTETHFAQKYCKKCLSHYINDITDYNGICLDVHYTMELECNKHEIIKTKVPQSIQECCGNCSIIPLFKQIEGYLSKYNYLDNNSLRIYNKVIESGKHCQLCGKINLGQKENFNSLLTMVAQWFVMYKL
uniref:Uncharacterized protein n=1 Tax=Rhizophagus irregularis (strain DAOM 181602 / DAOM 197198 / MUCL 43194) TaxID=747089 RepID=U9SME7_RHIID